MPPMIRKMTARAPARMSRKSTITRKTSPRSLVLTRGTWALSISCLVTWAEAVAGRVSRAARESESIDFFTPLRYHLAGFIPSPLARHGVIGDEGVDGEDEGVGQDDDDDAKDREFDRVIRHLDQVGAAPGEDVDDAADDQHDDGQDPGPLQGEVRS